MYQNKNIFVNKKNWKENKLICSIPLFFFSLSNIFTHAQQHCDVLFVFFSFRLLFEFVKHRVNINKEEK
jgi:hypothetical protein